MCASQLQSVILVTEGIKLFRAVGGDGHLRKLIPFSRVLINCISVFTHLRIIVVGCRAVRRGREGALPAAVLPLQQRGRGQLWRLRHAASPEARLARRHLATFAVGQLLLSPL